jgi:hypothetical protein
MTSRTAFLEIEHLRIMIFMDDITAAADLQQWRLRRVRDSQALVIPQ